MEAAILYYNYATQWKKNIKLLDSNEPLFTAGFEGPRIDLAGDWQIPAAGAYSFKLRRQQGQLAVGEVAEFVVGTDAEVIVSLTSSSPDFLASNTMGDSGDPHTWFMASEETQYIYSRTAAPEVFVNIINPSLTSSVTVQLAQGIREESDEPLSVSSKIETDGIARDKAALTAFYNATGGSGWSNNDGWLSEKPLTDWHGVVTDLTGLVKALYLHDNNLAGELPD